jgi:hypothetical protein
MKVDIDMEMNRIRARQSYFLKSNIDEALNNEFM